MRREAVAAIARWQDALGGDDIPSKSPFMVVNPSSLEQSFTVLHCRFCERAWLPEACRAAYGCPPMNSASFLGEYSVSVGTSLDGLEPINDAQRGQG